LRSDKFDLRKLPSSPTTILLMKIQTWNIRGLNAKNKQAILRERIKKNQPYILILQETKCMGKEVASTLQK
jgi:exonuclease III